MSYSSKYHLNLWHLSFLAHYHRQHWRNTKEQQVNMLPQLHRKEKKIERTLVKTCLTSLLKQLVDQSTCIWSYFNIVWTRNMFHLHAIDLYIVVYTPLYHPKTHLMFHSLSVWSGPSGTDSASASILAIIAASLAGFTRRYSFCTISMILTITKKTKCHINKFFQKDIW